MSSKRLKNAPELADDGITAIGEVVANVDWVIATGHIVFPVLFLTELVVRRLVRLVRRHGRRQRTGAAKPAEAVGFQETNHGPLILLPTSPLGPKPQLVIFYQIPYIRFIFRSSQHLGSLSERSHPLPVTPTAVDIEPVVCVPSFVHLRHVDNNRLGLRVCHVGSVATEHAERRALTAFKRLDPVLPAYPTFFHPAPAMWLLSDTLGEIGPQLAYQGELGSFL